MHLADAFIQSDLQSIQAIHFLSVCVFPGKRTHNLCAFLLFCIFGATINAVYFLYKWEWEAEHI